MTWSLHDAKNRLSLLVRRAADEPQVISVRGEPRAVVLSVDAYRRLTHRRAGGLRAFLQASPWADVDLDLDRARDLPRPLELDDGADGPGGAAGAAASRGP